MAAPLKMFVRYGTTNCAAVSETLKRSAAMVLRQLHNHVRGARIAANLKAIIQGRHCPRGAILVRCWQTCKNRLRTGKHTPRNRQGPVRASNHQINSQPSQVHLCPILEEEVQHAQNDLRNIWKCNGHMCIYEYIPAKFRHALRKQRRVISM